MPPISLEILAIFFLVGWLALETGWDLWKSVVLPLGLVLPPILGGIAIQAILFHGWLSVGAIAAVLLHLSGKIWLRMLGTALLVVAALFYGFIWSAIGFGLYWLLWEVNIMGGADALAAYSVFLFFPSQEAFWLLLAGIFLWALAVLLYSYRGKIVMRFRQMCLRLFLGELPSEHELESEGKPTIGGIWLGVLLYAAWFFLAVH